MNDIILQALLYTVYQNLSNIIVKNDETIINYYLLFKLLNKRICIKKN